MGVKTYLAPKFIVERDQARCIRCEVCANQCSFESHYYDAEDNEMKIRPGNCVGCHRCVTFCPTGALTVRKNPLEYRDNYNWRPEYIEDIIKQAETGGVLLTGMGDDKGQRIYWDHLVINASQVTNPSIDPLREPMELTTYLGRKPDQVELDADGNLKTDLSGLVKLDTPIMFAAMSYGAVSLNVHRSLARAATEMGTLWNTGEGGLHPSLYQYGKNTTVQVASGRFGVHPEYLDAARIIEIKIGQGAKPGIGGIEATRRIVRKIPKAKVLILAEYSNREYIISAIKAGAAAYVPKKAVGSELISAVRSVHQAGSFLYPSAAVQIIKEYLHSAEEDPYQRLTAKEKDILRLLAEGHTSREIADLLGVSPKTVNGHRMEIRKKLDLSSRADLVKYAIRHGLVSMDAEPLPRGSGDA